MATLLDFVLGHALDPLVWLSLALAVLTVYMIGFVREVRRLPPGPVPLPLIGNLLLIRKSGHLYEKAIEWSATYGDPFTLWLGPRSIVICSTKESFKDVAGPHRNHLGGRMQSNIGDLQKRGYEDVTFSDFSPSWDVLRRVAHVAMRKYARSEKLANLSALRVDTQIDELFSLKSSTEAGNATLDAIAEVNEFVEDIVSNVIAVSAFGAGFSKGDADYEKLQQAVRTFETDSPNGLPSDFLPILGWIFFRQERRLRNSIADFLDINDRMFEAAMKSHEPGLSDPRHFTDALLNARAEFLADNRDSAKYLSDMNLRQVVLDIFGGGAGTTKTVLSYCLVILADRPDLQQTLREEICDAIGSTTLCRHTDRPSLPRTDAFIQEVIRLYPAVPMAFPRRALADVTINQRNVPKDTNVITNVYAVNRDEEIWGPDARKFNPERFLTASKEQISQGFTSFGIGSRSCPGEKMAQSNILFILVRVLQKVRLGCPKGPGTASFAPVDSNIQIDLQRQNLLFTKIEA